jgi:hypothetical protein
VVCRANIGQPPRRAKGFFRPPDGPWLDGPWLDGPGWTAMAVQARTSRMDSTSGDRTLSRLGGEIPAFGDRIGVPQAWQPNWLAFSHGRAALAWLLERRPARSAVYCAYTCATIEAFFRLRTLPAAAFDIGAAPAEIAALAAALPKPRLVLVPILFGAPAWFEIDALRAALDPDDIIVLDAAQTAFGHSDFAVPSGGAVLSCPRKTTSLADGAVLAVEPGFATSSDTAALPTADYAAGMKLAARGLWATQRPELERQAVECNGASETNWPERICRMSDASRAILERLDPAWHRDTRLRNRAYLAAKLQSAVPSWSVDAGTPFSLPVFLGNRRAFLSALHAARVFATPLWPDAPCNAERHPVASWFAEHLVSLPVDQRHSLADLDRVAAAALQAAEPASVPAAAKAFVRQA